METRNVFELKGVKYAYADGHLALNDVSFSVRPGEQIAILGANGCGKSTLLKMMNGLLFPSSGKIVAFGAELKEDLLDSHKDKFTQEFRQKTGLVFQNSEAQLFCPTVLDEVRFGPLQLDLSPDETHQRAEDVLALLGISHLKERTPHTLSGGEKKRVSIAATLATNPAVLLLDEPTAGLDPKTEHALIELLSGLGQANKTVIIATHKLDIARRLCSRALVFNEQHALVADRPIEDVLNDMELLTNTNLIHKHLHSHDGVLHAHEHSHHGNHEHGHPHNKEHRHESHTHSHEEGNGHRHTHEDEHEHSHNSELAHKHAHQDGKIDKS